MEGSDLGAGVAGAAPEHPALRFYRWQAVAHLVWWALLYRITGGKHLYEVGSIQGSVGTRPSWLSNGTAPTHTHTHTHPLYTTVIAVNRQRTRALAVNRHGTPTTHTHPHPPTHTHTHTSPS